jgi:CheY-like chemotaxis protein
MLTANALPEHVEAAHAAGADRHLSKPIDARRLISTLIELHDAAPAACAAA